jgi:hypothetical protein
MKEQTRRATAYAAATHINESAASVIHGFERGRHTHMTPTYDYDAGAHIFHIGGGPIRESDLLSPRLLVEQHFRT